MKRFLLAALLTAFASSAYAAPDKYTFDKDHTHIVFFISHLGYSNMVGLVKQYDGHFTFDEKEPQKSTIDVTIPAAGIVTEIPKLDDEFKGDKFFNVAKYPTLTFKSTRVEVTGKNTGDVTGDFTMLGVTKPVVLHVTYNRSGVHPMTNNYVSGFSADAVIKRSEFGMSSFLPMVGDDVKVHIEVEGINAAKHSGNSKVPG